MKLKDLIKLIKRKERNESVGNEYEYVSGKGKEYFLKKGGTRPLKITIGEAYSIIHQMNEGKSLSAIYRDMDFHHNASEHSVRTFAKGYEDGLFDKVLERIK